MGEKSKVKAYRLETALQAQKAGAALDRCVDEKFCFIVLVMPLRKHRVDGGEPQMCTNLGNPADLPKVLSWVSRNMKTYEFGPNGRKD